MRCRATLALLLGLAWVAGAAAQAPALRLRLRLRLRLSVTEKSHEPPNSINYVAVGSGDVFFAPDGDRVFVKRYGCFRTAVPGGDLCVWDVARQKKVHAFDNCQAAALAPGGKAVALMGPFAGNGLTLRLVQTQSLRVTQEVAYARPGPRAAPERPMLFQGSLAFTPDARHLVIPDVTTLAVYDLKARTAARPLNDHPIQWLLGFTPDGMAICHHGSGLVHLWQLARGKEGRGVGPPRGTRHAAVDPGGRLLATFGPETVVVLEPEVGPPAPERLQLWDVASGKRTRTLDTNVVPASIERQFGNGNTVSIPGGVQGAAFSPDGRLLASCLGERGKGAGGAVHVFDTRTGKLVLHEAVPFCPQAVAFSPDGLRLAAAGGVGDFDLRVWDVTGLHATPSFFPWSR